jgi:hypothetical protein
MTVLVLALAAAICGRCLEWKAARHFLLGRDPALRCRAWMYLVCGRAMFVAGVGAILIWALLFLAQHLRWV